MKNPKVACIIQARMGSSRLPGKVLKDICGKPMLKWVIDRADRSSLAGQLIIATTTSLLDDPLEEFCKSNHVAFYRGSEFDVLDRYYRAALKVEADFVVRLTADCPLVDPMLIDQTIQALLDTGSDFSANRLPPPYHRTYPIGLDVEAATFFALENAWKNAVAAHEREHVMPYLYDPKNGFKVKVINHNSDLGSLRWTVDAPEDLEFIRQVVRRLDCRDDFSWLDILQLVNEYPELALINQSVSHKSMNDVDDRAKLEKGSNHG